VDLVVDLEPDDEDEGVAGEGLQEQLLVVYLYLT
jgi:hypothetical protein